MFRFRLVSVLLVSALTVLGCFGSPHGAPAAKAKSEKVYFADTDSDRDAGEEQFHRARRYYQSRRWVDAGKAYQKAAELDVEAGESYYNAGCCYGLARQADQAFAMLNKSIDEGFIDLDQLNDDDDLDSIRSDPRFNTLVSRARNTDPGKQRATAAKRRFDRLTAAKSKDESAWVDTGLDLLRTGEPMKAAQAFRSAYAVDSSASQIYNEACALSVAGKTSEALATLERAILAGSGDPDHMARDQDLRAVRSLSGYARLEDLADDLSLNQNGWTDRSRTRAWKRELPRYEQVTRDHPQIGRAWANLGYAKLYAKDPNGSIEAYQKALSLGYQPRLTMYN